MKNDDLISRQAAIEAFWCLNISIRPSAFDAITDMLKTLPSAQPEPIKITIDHVPTQDELERLKQAMRNTPVMLLPSAQPEDCDTCKYGYFGDGMCDKCRVRFQSHYERRTDER